MSESRIGARATFVLLRRALYYVWPVRFQLAVKLGLAMLGVTMMLVMPWPLKVLIDHVIMGIPVGQSPTPYPPYFAPLVTMLEGTSAEGIVILFVIFSLLFIALIGAFGSSSAARDGTDAGLAQGLDTATRSENLANISNSKVGGLLGYFEYRYQLRITHNLNHRFRSMLFGRLLALPMTHFAETSVGDSVYRVLYDTPSISRICYELAVTPVLAVFSISAIIWTTSYSFAAVPSIVWAAWAVTPLTLVVTFLMTGLARRRSAESRQAGAETTATLEEGMNNIVAVQSLGANKYERGRFEAESETSFKQFRNYMVVVIGMVALQVFIGMAMVFVVFFDVSEAIVDGRMSAGDYGVVFAYFLQLIGSTGALGALWFYLQDNIAAMARVFQTIDLPFDAEIHGDQELQMIQQGVALKHVSYSYPDGTSALTDINFAANIGEMIALVGATGAGKSTLTYLLPGFISADGGQTLVDDQDIVSYSFESLRRNVTFVFQEALIFDDTVTNNIRLGNPDASGQEIRQAAATAGALEFIDALPNGFETRLGQAGGTLSVGQKQRISIARGLVSPARVLILDEPTASLDPETEMALMAALNSERERRLLIVIAHRLSTIRSADRIYFLEQGSIVEQGSHAELMQVEGGAYRNFVNLQLGEVA